jgi:site-specific recombinase XerD
MQYPVPDIVEQFLNYRLINKRQSKNTIKSYNHDISLLCKYIDKDITELTVNDLYAWVASMNTVSKNTVSRRVATLKAFFGWLYQRGLIQTNISLDLEPPKTYRKTPKYLTEEEAEKLKQVVLQKKNKRDILMLTLMLNLGLRESEIVDIQLQNIIDGKIHITGKGDKTRTVYLNDKCIEALSKYLPVREKRATIGTYLFYSNRTKDGRLSTSQVRYITKKYCKLIGIDTNKAHPHALRHTTGTILTERGVPIREIQELLGHGSITTTTIYTHITDKSKQEIANKINI